MFKTFQVINKDDIIFQEDLLQEFGDKNRVINMYENYKQMTIDEMKLLLFILNEKVNKILDVIDEEKIDSVYTKLEKLLNLLEQYE